MAKLIPDNIQFFASGLQFREWLESHCGSEKEIWVGFYKRETGKPSLTWSESVDEALCFGWIDGIRKSVDSVSYTIRFTPRNPKSIWSAVNIAKIETLTKQGLMKPQGIKIFEARKEKNAERYSFEQKIIEFTEPYLSYFKENKKAWDTFQSMAPSYKRTATWWVMSARQEGTRKKRLEILILDSEKNLKVPPLRR
jgi:uncharacterized protein YdeI (YjbR/CyaY-like superfamily)